MTRDSPSSCALPSQACIGIGDMFYTQEKRELILTQAAPNSKQAKFGRLTGLDSFAYSYMMALFCHFVPDGESSCISLPAGVWLDPVDLHRRET